MSKDGMKSYTCHHFFISLSDYARIFIMKTKTGKVREQTYGIASFLYYFYRITTAIEPNFKETTAKNCSLAPNY